MDMLGLDFSVWGIIKTLLLMMLVFILYDWYDLLAWRRKYKIRSAFPLPLIGTLYAINIPKPGVKEIDQVQKYGGPVFGVHENLHQVKNAVYTNVLLSAAKAYGSMGCVKMLNVYDIELLKKIMVKDHVKFQNRFTMDGIDPPPADKDILNLKDAHWKRVRGIMTPSFSGSKLKMMTSEINRCADILAQGLIEKAESKETIEPRLHFGCYTMDVIASTAFGIKTDSYSTPNDPFVYHAQKAFSGSVFKSTILFAFMFNRTMKVLCKCFGVSGFFPKDSLAFFRDATKKILKERQADGYNGRVDILQLMLNAEDPDAENQSRKKLTEEELIAQVFIIFLAGYETTGTLLTFAAYALATHPDIQDKLIAEIDNYMGEDETEIKYDVVMEMPYLDQVVCETLRMYPPLPRMNRSTSADQDVEIDGHWFPANTMIVCSIYAIHHEMGFYEEPEEFIPERFSPEEKAKRDPFTFIPFGHGPRNCIGMRLALLEAKIALVTVLRKMKFVKVAATEVPLGLWTIDAVLKPLKPIKVGVELR